MTFLSSIRVYQGELCPDHKIIAKVGYTYQKRLKIPDCIGFFSNPSAPPSCHDFEGRAFVCILLFAAYSAVMVLVMVSIGLIVLCIAQGPWDRPWEVFRVTKMCLFSAFLGMTLLVTGTNSFLRRNRWSQWLKWDEEMGRQERFWEAMEPPTSA